MTAIPKPPPPTKNKGTKKWDAYRQSRLRSLFLGGEPRCQWCNLRINVQFIKGRYVSGGLFHHIKRRLPHADLKYNDANVPFLCTDCHSNAHDTSRRKDARPNGS